MIIETMQSWVNGEPVWSHAQILERWGRDFLMYRTAWEQDEHDVSYNITRSLMLHECRDQAIKQFGFSIPCKELLDALEQHQPIVEVGAGSGYMTALMRHRGINVIGTDSGHGHGRISLKFHDPDQMIMPAKRAVRRYRDRTVFCSWPSLNETWFRQALRAMRINQKAIIIEEDSCAEETTWNYRDRSFYRMEQIEVPTWPHMNDFAAVWIKKRHAAQVANYGD
jgi:hypothetical protein